jgi:hypothetical protein
VMKLFPNGELPSTRPALLCTALLYPFYPTTLATLHTLSNSPQPQLYQTPSPL